MPLGILQSDAPRLMKIASTEMKLTDRHGGDITEWPDNLKIRQFPIKLKNG